MLARYKIYRGKRPADDPQPEGIRQDTRKHTRHVLRPPAALVTRYLDNPSAAAWRSFKSGYLATIKERFADDREPFDQLAALSKDEDVHLGCSCPTQKNPDVHHCHTVLALRFMRSKYRSLTVEIP